MKLILPGIKKEDITLNYANNYLSISAVRNETFEDKKDNYVRKERNYGQFKRNFYIDNVDAANVDAAFNDGILKITLPKKEQGSTSKNIDIK